MPDQSCLKTLIACNVKLNELLQNEMKLMTVLVFAIDNLTKGNLIVICIDILLIINSFLTYNGSKDR